MKVVLDTNSIIKREIPVDSFVEAYITSSVEKEILDKQSIDYRQSLGFLIQVRDPQEQYVKQVKSKIQNILHNLSEVDIEVIALTLEINDELSNEWIGVDNLDAINEVKCLTQDNGMKQVLNMFGLLNESNYQNKKFKMRCYSCFEVYDHHVDFCKKCGYNTITRVSVIETEEGEKILLSKYYKPKPKVLKNKNGKIIESEDQKEYSQYIREKNRNERIRSNINFFE